MITAFIAASLFARLSEADRFAGYGRAILAQIEKEFRLPLNEGYAEDATSAGPGKRAYNWSIGELLNAYDAAAAYDPKYKPDLRRVVDFTAKYFADPGFAVLPNQPEPDRYYDDNAWMALELWEAGAVLGDKDALTLGLKAEGFALSGLDAKLGGGVWWREHKKESKNTCSNAPTATAALALYKPLPGSKLLTQASEIYDWTMAHLHDPKTGLFWDNLNLKGVVEPTFWSYNTALMIDANAMLFRATGQTLYAQRAQLLEEQSAAHWVNEDGAITDPPFFAEKLVEAWLVRLLVAPMPGENFGKTVAIKLALEYLHKNGPDKNGHYAGKWSEKHPQPIAKWMLLDQAAAARAFFLEALYLKNKTIPLAN